MWGTGQSQPKGVCSSGGQWRHLTASAEGDVTRTTREISPSKEKGGDTFYHSRKTVYVFT